MDGSENNCKDSYSLPFQIVHVSSYMNFMLILCFLHIKEKKNYLSFLKTQIFQITQLSYLQV